MIYIFCLPYPSSVQSLLFFCFSTVSFLPLPFLTSSCTLPSSRHACPHVVSTTEAACLCWLCGHAPCYPICGQASCSWLDESSPSTCCTNDIHSLPSQIAERFHVTPNSYAMDLSSCCYESRAPWGGFCRTDHCPHGSGKAFDLYDREILLTGF